MKKLTLAIASFLLFSSGAFAGVISDLSAAELKSTDLSGHYTGKRYQYTADKKSIMQTFQYEFELKQEGSAITGTSTIIKENGDYADIKLRGTIVGDKLYFEEYEIANQIKDQNMVWCFKSGALNIKKDGDRVKLTGATNSYMAEYYLPCTGGETDLTKVESSPTLNPDVIKTASTGLPASDVMSVYPNPFVDQTQISYTLATDAAKVTTEVYDITGRRVAVLESDAARSAGTHAVAFSARSYGLSAGVLIAKVSVDGVVYSSEMVQMK
ncbi:MAG: T9SS type A sorting domain-containing protein [Bacteroidetes bacterium]|nr:T9SS type A sorting domain-containing protein [Bacteroidota bacterium]